MDWAKLTAILKAEEGLKLKAYQDSIGIWTVGYGHNLEADGMSKADAAHVVWTQAQAEMALTLDAQKAVDEVLAHFPWSVKLNCPRLAVLACMAFQMGINGLAGFHNTLESVKSGRYVEAAQRMMLSKWARQTPARAQRMAEIMRSGEWPDA